MTSLKKKKIDLSYIEAKHANVIDTLDNQRAVSYQAKYILIKLNILLTFDPAISFLWIYPSEMQVYVLTQM